MTAAGRHAVKDEDFIEREPFELSPLMLITTISVAPLMVMIA